MRLIRNIILPICFIILTGTCFAEPGIKITAPLDGTTVNPGQEIVVRIESVEGFVVEEGVANISGSDHNERIRALPVSFTDKIPKEAVGELSVFVFAKDAAGNLAMDDIILNVQQTSSLVSFDIGDVNKFTFTTDWNGIPEAGDKDCMFIDGVYADGVIRGLVISELTFTSADSSIASVDEKGCITPHKIGKTTITISSGNITKVIPVEVRLPRGLRPSEIIPPAIQIDIQPSANSAGWYTQDITITLTAQDNPGGSGIQEIVYSFPYLSADSNFIENNQVIIPFSKEGVNLLRYGASDNEGNDTGQQSVELRLDKTPPQASISATPNILWPPNNKIVDVTIDGQAADGASGIDTLTFKVSDEYGKIEPKIIKFGETIQLEAAREGNDKDGRAYTISVIAKDKAGNESSAATTVTVPHDMEEKK